MPEVTPNSTIKSLVEVAWLSTRVGQQIIADRVEPSSEALRGFWQSTRSLQQHWTKELDNWAFETDTELLQLEEISAQLFATELTSRVWATVLAGIDQQTGKNDLTRIATNVVSGLLQIRHRVMSLLMAVANNAESRVAAIERLRRKCDRWTDLLIGHIAGYDATFEFAFDVERARDFAEEYAEESSVSRGTVNQLVATGLRLAFIGQLPDICLQEPAFDKLTKAILSSFPQSAVQPDEGFRSTVKLCDPDEDEANERPISEAPFDPTSSDVLLPGISFAKLRRRFR